jgi:Holliday junction resolvase RusA-like endonuclease
MINTPINVFIPCNLPTVTSQQKGAFSVPGGRGVRFFKKAKVKASEATFHALLLPHVPSAPFAGPLRLTLGFIFPWRKTERKSVMRAHSEVPVTTRPDLSNLVKTLEDVMTTLRFWGDDSQISDLRLTKRYADTPGLRIEISEDSPIQRTP